MKTWHDLTLNPSYIMSFYSSPPTLSRVEIFKISLNRDGPTLTLTLDGIALPDNPPLKWHNHEYNKAQLALDFFDISAIELSKWGRNNIVDIVVAEDSDRRILVNCHNSDVILSFACNNFKVTKLSTYLDKD